MIKKEILLFVLIFSLILSFFSIKIYGTTELNDGRKEIFNAFEKATEAYQAGGNIGEIVNKLNKAIDLLYENREYEANQLAEEARNEASLIKEGAFNFHQNQRIWLIFGFLGFFSMFSIALLIIWYFSNGINKIKKKLRKVSPLKAGNEAWAFVLTTIIVVAAFVYTESLYMSQTLEPFSEFSILDPNLKMSDYPDVVEVNETFRLNVYVANHMGKPMYYFVMVKYAEINSPLDPSPGTVIQTSERILLNNETCFFRFDLFLKEEGFWRLIFELWAYNTSSGNVEYLSPYWGQIWINATI